MKRESLDGKKEPFVRLMLDSGAYSAWNSGAEIDIDEYISFIKKHEHLLESYINLDVIPGKRGKTRTAADTEAAAQASYDNWWYMKDQGLSPIPVFHQGERFVWLDKYRKDGCKYVSIGIQQDMMLPSHVKFLDKVFTVLTDEAGRPKIRVHGLGVTSLYLLLRYPWYSVDSTSWAMTGAYGAIIVPARVNGKPDYSRQPQTIKVSGVATKSGGGRDEYEVMGPMIQKYIADYLREVCGLTLVEVRNDLRARMICNIHYFTKMAEACVDVRFKHRLHDWHGE